MNGKADELRQREQQTGRSVLKEMGTISQQSMHACEKAKICADGGIAHASILVPELEAPARSGFGCVMLGKLGKTGLKHRRLPACPCLHACCKAHVIERPGRRHEQAWRATAAPVPAAGAAGSWLAAEVLVERACSIVSFSPSESESDLQQQARAGKSRDQARAGRAGHCICA